jgi:hypothetical protein
VGVRRLIQQVSDTIFGKVDPMGGMKTPARAGYRHMWHRMTAILYSGQPVWNSAVPYTGRLRVLFGAAASGTPQGVTGGTQMPSRKKEAEWVLTAALGCEEGERSGAGIHWFCPLEGEAVMCPDSALMCMLPRAAL